MVESSIPLDIWNGSASTKELEKTILKLSESSNRQTSHVIKLTYAMLFLTLIMSCMVGVQIWLSLQSVKTKQIQTNPITVLSSHPSQAQSEKARLSVKNINSPSPQKAQSEKD